MYGDTTWLYVSLAFVGGQLETFLLIKLHLTRLYLGPIAGVWTIFVYCIRFMVNGKTAVFGRIIGYCWISGEYHVWRVVCFYVPLWVAFSYIISCYIYIFSRMITLKRRLNKFAGRKQSVFTEAQGSIGRFVKRILIFMLVFWITWFWGTYHRIYQLVHGSTSIPIWVYMLHQIFAPLQGFFNAIFFFYFTLTSSKKIDLFSKTGDIVRSINKSSKLSMPAPATPQTPNSIDSDTIFDRNTSRDIP